MGCRAGLGRCKTAGHGAEDTGKSRPTSERESENVLGLPAGPVMRSLGVGGCLAKNNTGYLSWGSTVG